MDTTSLGFQKPKEEEYYDINIFNKNTQLANDLIEKNSSAIGQIANERGYAKIKSLGSLDDLNNIFGSGKYFSNQCLNRPISTDAFLIDVTGDGNSVVVQKATCYYGAGNVNFGKIYERIFYQASGGWTSWREIPTVNNISNPAININPDFQIWQRGTSFLNITQYATYTADRWRIDVNNGSKASVEKVVNGVKFTVNLNGSFNPLYVQELEINSYIQGKKLTFSTEFKDINGNFHIRLQYLKNGVYTPIVSELIQSNKKISVTADIPNDIERLWAIIGSIPSTANGSFFIIKSAKLELGEIATPLSPRPYGMEKVLCKRYYQKIIYTVLPSPSSGTEYRSMVPANFTDMRVNPTVRYIESPASLVKGYAHAYGIGDIAIGSNTSWGVGNNGSGFVLLRDSNQAALVNSTSYAVTLALDSEIY